VGNGREGHGCFMFQRGRQGSREQANQELRICSIFVPPFPCWFTHPGREAHACLVWAVHSMLHARQASKQFAQYINPPTRNHLPTANACLGWVWVLSWGGRGEQDTELGRVSSRARSLPQEGGGGGCQSGRDGGRPAVSCCSSSWLAALTALYLALVLLSCIGCRVPEVQGRSEWFLGGWGWVVVGRVVFLRLLEGAEARLVLVLIPEGAQVDRHMWVVSRGHR